MNKPNIPLWVNKEDLLMLEDALDVYSRTIIQKMNIANTATFKHYQRKLLHVNRVYRRVKNLRISRERRGTNTH